MAMRTLIGTTVALAIAASASAIAVAATLEIDPDVLEKVQIEAAATTLLLYDPDINKPFIAEDWKSKHTLSFSGIIFDQLVKANPGHEGAIEAVINEKLVPLIVSQRHSLFCHRKQRYYDILQASLDAYLKQTGTQDRKKALACNCLAYLPPEEQQGIGWVRLTISYILFKGWDDIVAAGLVVPKMWVDWPSYGDENLPPREAAGRELENAFKLSASCGAPFSAPFPMTP